MKLTITLLAVLALTCAAFAGTTDPKLVIQGGGGSWDIPYGATSFAFDLSSTGGCSNTTAVVGGSTVGVSLGAGTVNPTACIFRNDGPSTWSNLDVIVQFLAPQPNTLTFTGGSNVFASFSATPFINGSNMVTGVLYAFFGGAGAPPCPNTNCEPDFMFSDFPNSVVTVIPNVPEPASLALTGTGLLFLSRKIRKLLRKA
jgi:hypothetical protein